MFDMGFSEILLIAVISLIVIGPKRMPETVRFLGYWFGKIRRSVHSARQEMEREFGLDEIRRDLHNEALLNQLDKERKQLESILSSDTPKPPPAASIHNEAEMLQAFEDFDQEFGEDTNTGFDANALPAQTLPAQTPNPPGATASSDTNTPGSNTTSADPADTATQTAVTKIKAPATPAAKPANKSGESGKS